MSAKICEKGKIKMKRIKLGVGILTAAAILAGCANDGQETQPAEETQQETQVETAEPEPTTETGDSLRESSPDIQSELEQPFDDDMTGLQSQTFEIDLMAAADIFFETFSDASISSVDFEYDSQNPRYSIEGFDGQNEYEMDIHAETGKILNQETESDAGGDDEAIDFSLIITPQEAMEAALETTDSGRVRDWDLSVEDGRTVYEIDIEGENTDLFDDIEVDAFTGEIISRS